MRGSRILAIGGVALAGFLGTASAVGASPVFFFDRTNYETAAGAQIEVDFTDLPPLTVVSNQYAGLGLTFTDGNDVIGAGVGSGDPDAHDLVGAASPGLDMGITFTLSGPRASVGLDFGPLAAFGNVQVAFFSGATNVGGVGGQTTFVGILSADQLIDRVVVSPSNIGGELFAALIGDVLFAAPAPTSGDEVPEPASLLLVGTGLAAALRQRRRRQR